MTDLASSKTLMRYAFSWWELTPLVVAVACYFMFPDYHVLGASVCVMAIFALSLDLVIGFAGIVTLGHSVFFGIGAYAAALASRNGWHEPISIVALSAAAATIVAALSGPFVLRLKGLPLIMVTMGIAAIGFEAGNKLSWLTGGTDGLPGLVFDPIFGRFRWGMNGSSAFVYVLIWAVVIVVVARTVVASSFGVALQGIRQNELRMRVMGAPVLRQLVIIYAFSASIAGIAGALYAETNSFVGLETLSVDMSVFALAMIVLGGIGRLYGALAGATVYMIVQYSASQWDPYYWMLVIGIMLVVVVRFGKGGLLGIAADTLAALRHRQEARP